MLPGMGDVKARHLTEAFEQPFQVYGGPGPRETRDTSTDAAYGTSSAPIDVADDAEDTVPPPVQGSVDSAPPVNVRDGGVPDPLAGLPDNFESLPEEEQLHLALQLSMDRDSSP